MPINRKLLNPGESVVVSTRTHPKALLLPLLCFGVVMLFARMATKKDQPS